MPTVGDVVWAVDPFRPNSGNPRPWLVVSGSSLPYSESESIALALTTQSHHRESREVPSDAWRSGEPEARSHVLPWTVTTLKHEAHVVGRQGRLTDDFVADVVSALISYLEPRGES